MIAADDRPLEEAAARALERIEERPPSGPADGKLFAFRDTGFRPLSSGTCTATGVASRRAPSIRRSFEREIRPGELLIAGDDGAGRSRFCRGSGPGACIFGSSPARPDTCLDGVEVHGARCGQGTALLGAPSSDSCCRFPTRAHRPRSASRATGIRSARADPNRQVHRTFIHPEQMQRGSDEVQPARGGVRQRLVVVDDRSSAARRRARSCRCSSTRARRRCTSDLLTAVVSPCYYGIDLASESEMIAAGNTVEGVRAAIGATSLAYLSLEGLQEATERPAASLCRACLTREYPTSIPAATGKLRFEAVR
jgi:amidophosphoribosyltransferase